MMKNIQPIRSSTGILGIVCGSFLIGVPAIPLASLAMPLFQPNSCLEHSVDDLDNQGRSRLSTHCAVSQSTPPLPEQLQDPSAVVVLVEGRVNVRLINLTYTDVSYQVIGTTEERILSGRHEVTLEGIQTPVTITFVRPDSGFLLASPQATETGMLDVTLQETTDLGLDRSVMTIQENGAVFLN